MSWLDEERWFAEQEAAFERGYRKGLLTCVRDTAVIRLAIEQARAEGRESGRARAD